MGYPSGEESADAQWRPEGWGAIQVDDRSVPGRDGGGKRLQVEIEAASTGEIWREIRDRSGGREKRNEKSRKNVEEIVGRKG